MVHSVSSSTFGGHFSYLMINSRAVGSGDWSKTFGRFFLTFHLPARARSKIWLLVRRLVEEEENRRRQKTTNRGNKNSWWVSRLVSVLSSMVFDHLFSLLHPPTVTYKRARRIEDWLTVGEGVTDGLLNVGSSSNSSSILSSFLWSSTINNPRERIGLDDEAVGVG